MIIWSISQFIYGNQYIYNIIRQEIYNEVALLKNFIPYAIIETNNGNNIKNDGFHGRGFEISIAYDINKFNIAQYKVILNKDDKIIGYQFINYYNNDNNELKNLLLIINFNDNHWNIGYYNNTHLDLNYHIQNYLIDINLQDECNNIVDIKKIIKG